MVHNNTAALVLYTDEDFSTSSSVASRSRVSRIALRASAKEEVSESSWAYASMNECSLCDCSPKLVTRASLRPHLWPVVHSVLRKASSYSEYTPAR